MANISKIKAIEILENYNEFRRGRGKIKYLPREISEAIEIAIKELRDGKK